MIFELDIVLLKHLNQRNFPFQRKGSNKVLRGLTPNFCLNA